MLKEAYKLQEEVTALKEEVKAKEKVLKEMYSKISASMTEDDTYKYIRKEVPVREINKDLFLKTTISEDDITSMKTAGNKGSFLKAFMSTSFFKVAKLGVGDCEKEVGANLITSTGIAVIGNTRVSEYIEKVK